MAEFEIIVGDCLEVLRSLPDESVDAMVTSPPYAEQRKDQYGGIPEREYAGWTVVYMHEVRRILKPTGSAIVNIREHVRGGEIDDYVHRTRLSLRWAGWYEIDELIWVKPCPMPSGAADRPRRAWERLLWFGKTSKPYVDATAHGRESDRIGMGDEASAAYREMGHGGNSPLRSGRSRHTDVVECYRDSRTEKSNHPAAYPVALADWCVRQICPEGGVVLDPFSGSGTTGVSAVRHGRGYIGIERDPEHAERSKTRIAEESKNLFAMVATQDGDLWSLDDESGTQTQA